MPQANKFFFLSAVILVLCVLTYWHSVKLNKNDALNPSQINYASNIDIPKSKPNSGKTDKITGYSRGDQNSEGMELLDTMKYLVSSEKTDELLAALGQLSAQQTAELNSIIDTQEFNRLRRLLGRDPVARLAALDKLRQAAGTPYGTALVRALSMSANAKELPEVKTLAIQLLRSNSQAKQLDALHLLKHTNIQDAETRAYVIELLQRNQGGDVAVTLAALETLRGSDETSAERQAELANTLSPYLHSDDVTLRAGGLRALAQAGGDGAEALQAFTEAALGEENPGVRAIAISALGEAKFQYEDVRSTLLNLLADPNESKGAKAAAGRALAAYPLDNDAEAQAIYASYKLEQQTETKQIGFN